MLRFRHCMIRVGDLSRSLEFYVDLLGITLFRREDYPDGRFTLAFVGYEGKEKATMLELTHNLDIAHYSHGNGFGHLALNVDNIFKTCSHPAPWGIARRNGHMQKSLHSLKTLIAIVSNWSSTRSKRRTHKTQ